MSVKSKIEEVVEPATEVVAEEPVVEVVAEEPVVEETPLEVEARETQALLDAARAQAAPLITRLATVDTALADLDSQSTAVPVEGGASVLLDDEIAARKVAASKRNELVIERTVVLEHLKPIRAEVDRLETVVAEKRLAANKAKTLADGTAALARVAEARAALDAEIAALTQVSRSAPVRWNILPDMHFAVQAEMQQIGLTARSLGMASF